MTNRPEWMLTYFRDRIESVLRDYPNRDEAVEELALMVTRFALMPPDAVKDEVEQETE